MREPLPWLYAIDRDGHQHGYPAGECATFEEARDGLFELMYHGSLDSEPDEPFFVRYGITFTEADAPEVARRLAAPQPT